MNIKNFILKEYYTYKYSKIIKYCKELYLIPQTSKHYSLKVHSIPKIELDNNSWWYIHGQLEKDLGYDKGCLINCLSLNVSKETVNWITIKDGKCNPRKYYNMYFNGIIDIKVEGIDKPCVGYFWTENTTSYDKGSFQRWKQRGLICYKDDIEGREYALDKYLNKFLII